MDTTISIWVVLSLLTGHYVFDFALQSQEMAIKKKERGVALLRHVMIYSAGMSVVVAFLGASSGLDYGQVWIPLWEGYAPTLGVLVLGFWGVTFLLHALTDATTAPVTSDLHAGGHHHNFFVVIGMDQLLHFVQILITYQLLFGRAG